MANWHWLGILLRQSQNMAILFILFIIFLIPTGVCPTTVNMEANAPKHGTASIAPVMEPDTVEQHAITVSDS